jgi:transcriptional/translational regulatory protein YebC/TACO1
MAGHSHWANIARKKSLIDNKRGKLWSKLAKGIMVAAKAGGGDPNGNLRLRYAIIDAKAGNMPKDTIDRAIKKGTGELEGVNFEEILYEGYGPAGVAILCDILTDNRNRTADNFDVICDPNAYSNVSEAVEKAGLKTEVSHITRIPKDTVDLDAASAQSVLKLMEALDDHDDVQSVAANFNIPDEAMAAIEAAGR